VRSGELLHEKAGYDESEIISRLAGAFREAVTGGRLAGRGSDNRR